MEEMGSEQKMERKWRENEKMEREWGNGERERDFLPPIISKPFVLYFFIIIRKLLQSDIKSCLFCHALGNQIWFCTVLRHVSRQLIRLFTEVVASLTGKRFLLSV